jgi:Ca-activated chloride channel family protein
MKRLLLLLAVLGAHSLPAFGQGILLPQDTRIAPFPRPVPGPHPLRVKSLKIETRIQGQVATTRVSQVFGNDLDFVVEGLYLYPLPEDATFVDFATWDGDKKLRGEVLEKEEAKRRYLAIVRRSWDPGLLEYAGINLFQARVFPVPARGEKRVEFAYSQILKADQGLVSYSYPLQSGTQVNPQPIANATVMVEIQSEQGLKNIYSPTHNIDVHRDGDRRARLSYEATNVLPDRNFQLFYSLSNAEFGLSLITHRESGEDGYFMILLSPKIEHDSAAVIAKDIIFVLDTSGSMQDKGKMEKARAALKFGIRSLNPADQFNIVTFSTEARKFRDGLVTAGEENREAATQFIERQNASGGTNIHEALKEGLGSFRPGDRPRYLIFLTDGLPTVGETDPGKILRDVTTANTLKARLFSFGVGYDVNTFLLDQLAARNFGAPDYVTPDEDLEVKVSNFFAKVSSPVMTGIEFDLNALRGEDIYPRQVPDLFRGSQLSILGRYSASGTIPLTLRATIRGQSRMLKFDQNNFASVNSANDFLPRLWAMRKVGFLLEQIRMSGENAEVKNEIIRLAKKYGFVTPYTSYLALDEKDLISGNQPVLRMRNLQMGAGVAGGVAAAPPAAAAQDAVYASRTLREMKSAEVSLSQGTSKNRRVGSKVFMEKEGAWVDSAYDPNAKLAVVDLLFGSEELLKAITGDRQLASYAALGKNVTVVHKGKVYRIHPSQ